MKTKLKNLLIAIVVVAVLAVYLGSSYIWAARAKSKAPAGWVLAYEGKNPSLVLPWTWFFPEPTGLWFITATPRKLDSSSVNGQNLVLADIVAFHRNGGQNERSEYSEIVSLDRAASHILSDEELKDFLAGRIDNIQFDWKTNKGDNAGAAIVKYCSDHAVQEGPEVAPHFPTNSFTSLGTFFRNYAYARLPENGQAWDTTSVGVATAREKGLLLIRQSETDQFAILDLSDGKSLPQKPSDLKFQPVTADNILSKAWSRATTPEAFSNDRMKGRFQEWVFVEMLVEGKQMSRFYVGAKIEKLPEFGLPYVPMLEVSMEYFTVHTKPKTKQCAVVQTDFFWVPIEDKGYDDLNWQKIEPGSIGEAVSKLVMK